MLGQPKTCGTSEGWFSDKVPGMFLQLTKLFPFICVYYDYYQESQKISSFFLVLFFFFLVDLKLMVVELETKTCRHENVLVSSRNPPSKFYV